jgi:arylsulfatase A-like enzyme
LKGAGYRTGFIGKFGVGVGGVSPKGGMFDFYRPINRNPYFHEQPDGTKRHESDLCGDRAIEFLADCKPDQPFCLSVSFNAAHAEDGDKVNHFPWPPSEDGLYEDETIPPPLVSMDHWKSLPEFFHDGMHRERFHWRWDTPEKYQRNVKAYYRMITGLDRNVGRVVAELDRLGFAKNTVVVFMGDNGYYKGSRGFAGKWSHFEESLRVPLVVFDPRAPEAARGRVEERMALNVDVTPTILEYGGVPVPESYQGHSLVPLVQGETPDDWRTDFFCEHLMVNPGIPQYEGVRGTRYVYARYLQHLPEGEFLHDLESDPLEMKNLAGDAAHARILDEMRARCDELRDELGGEYNRERFPLARDRRAATSRKPRGE